MSDSAIRYESDWSKLGEAAGIAARIAVRTQKTVQELSIAELQRSIHEAGGITIYLPDVPPNDLDFGAAQWIGTLGGFHGLATPAANKLSSSDPATPGIQKLRLGHQANLDVALDETLRERWLKLLTNGISSPPAEASKEMTRRGFLRQLQQARKSKDGNVP